MNPEQIPIISVSYNSPELIEVLLRSIRRFYPNRIYIIDGSNDELANQIKEVTLDYENVEFIPFGYNIHHGPGMAWAIKNLGLSGPALFLDSDVEILNGGFLESLLSHLTPDLYGVGDITYPQLADVPEEHRGIGYLSPACMLCNIDVMRNWPVPIKHGAPMVLPMLALAKAGKIDLIRQVDWVKNDYANGTTKIHFRHDWQGTVTRTGGYHYDTEPVASNYNYALLPLIPKDVHNIMEIGCNNGALARAYKNINPICNYTGVDIDPAAVRLARKSCDFVFNMNIESADERFFQDAGNCDCWVFSEVLEYLNDPWALLAKIRKIIPANGTIIACIPNMQYWGVQAGLSHGELKNGIPGLTELGHLRWFTRTSILEMFQNAGFQVVSGAARVAKDSGEKFFPAIRAMAECMGGDPEVAIQDAKPLQYLIKAIPVQG